MSAFINFFWKYYQQSIVKVILIPYVILLFLIGYLSITGLKDVILGQETEDISESKINNGLMGLKWAALLYFFILRVPQRTSLFPFDIPMIFLKLVLTTLSMIYQDMISDKTLRILGAFTVFTMWLRIYLWLRIFDSCSPYVLFINETVIRSLNFLKIVGVLIVAFIGF